MNDRHRVKYSEVYERRAAEWQQRRPPRMDEAVRFTAGLTAMADPDTADDTLPDDNLPDDTLPDDTLPDDTLLVGAVVDLGCGPGWHLPALPAGTIAVDGAAAMVDPGGRHSPGSPVVQADLRALPFARHSLRAVWANKSLVHLERAWVPSPCGTCTGRWRWGPWPTSGCSAVTASTRASTTTRSPAGRSPCGPPTCSPTW